MAIKLYVANLPLTVTDEQLQSLFELPDADCISFVEHTKPGEPESKTVLVEVDSPEKAADAISRLNGHKLEDRRMAVSMALPSRYIGALSDEQKQLAREIAKKLQENKRIPCRQILGVVRWCGPEFANSLVEEIEEIEAAGGMMLEDGSRKRTPGGIFFKLTKDRISIKMRGAIFNPARKKKKKVDNAAQQPQKETPPAKAKRGKKAEAADQPTDAAQQPDISPELTRATSTDEMAQLAPEEAAQLLAQLREAHEASSKYLEQLKTNPSQKQTGLFSAMKQVLDLKRQIDQLLEAHPDLS
jgi:hypothetical protein